MFPARKRSIRQNSSILHRRKKVKHNQVFVKEFKFRLLSLLIYVLYSFYKETIQTKNAYFKDFMDKIEDEPEVAEELGIIMFI